jgi:2-polyprenyl-3-methyl-5-hydroxy-6-metoxy-1,4-benzoquinol methylase
VALNRNALTTGQIKEGNRLSFPATPREALGPLTHEQVTFGNRTFVIERPLASDHLMDDPRIQAEFNVDEFLPYWTEIWPGARMLGKVLFRENWPPGERVLEVGCGLGLAGICGLACGLRVTFSDYDRTALEFAEANARLNRFSDFEVLPLDWRWLPSGLRFRWIIGADVTYELRNINPLVNVMQEMLEPDGTCLLADPDRLPAYNLCDALVGEGFQYTRQTVHAGEPGGRRHKGTLYRIQWRHR